MNTRYLIAYLTDEERATAHTHGLDTWPWEYATDGKSVDWWTAGWFIIRETAIAYRNQYCPRAKIYSNVGGP